jgi:nucleoside-diphosphate-sugar epimerase
MKRLLIAGYGDVARRALPQLALRFDVQPLMRAEGNDLDRPGSLIIEATDAVLHLAPPPSAGAEDPRTENLLSALERCGAHPTRVVYVSTSGVYGNCGGAWVDESRPVAPQTDRARRRLDAEQQLRHWCERRGAALVILRAPGIYALDRLPIERLRSGVPALLDRDDVFTSHIHADDLACAVVRALDVDAPVGIFNASDDSELKMGDWLDLVADHASLPRPRRVSREEAARCVPALPLSFMGESRRLVNRKLKEALGVRLQFPTVHEGLKHESALGIH